MGMESARSYRETATTMRRFTIAEYQGSLTGSGGALNTEAKEENAGKGQNGGSPENEEVTEAMEQSAATLQDWQNRLQASNSGAAVRTPASQTYAGIRHSTISYIFELLFSERRNRLSQWLQENGIQTGDYTQTARTVQTGSGVWQSGFGLYYGKGLASQPQRLKVLTYNQAVIRTEAEDTAFSTMGTVRTADGREIPFQVNVGMSRRFQEYYEESLELGTVSMCDPLVINLDTELTKLSDQTFYFDIDGDGEMDEISQLGAGSGYLALDHNGDGIINDGSELFGTSSGNGFADLAKYDEDGNGWIDENDAIWSKLKIWCRDENGKDVLYRLSDKGVGAICLQNVSTDFTVKGQEGRTKGAVRNTGIFLYENGAAGTVQHVDLAKYSAQA